MGDDEYSKAKLCVQVFLQKFNTYAFDKTLSRIFNLKSKIYTLLHTRPNLPCNGNALFNG